MARAHSVTGLSLSNYTKKTETNNLFEARRNDHFWIDYLWRLGTGPWLKPFDQQKVSRMGSPAKPFACSAADCGMTFTNEDHLTVHSKKHDMALHLGLGQKTNIYADQTPTPTRFIRNCEEVGLFQDLQNVNPFDEGFKRAMETKNGMIISLDNAIAAATSDDALHTPHIFPNLSDATESGLYNSTTKKTITRSSSDESTTVKHFETSTIETKLRNEVTIGRNDVDTSNTITIQSNIEIRKSDFSTIVASHDPNLIKLVVTNNSNDLNVVRKDVMLTDTGKVPVMSQQSLDFAIDSLTSHVECRNEVEKERPKNHSLINNMKKKLKSALNRNQQNESNNETKIDVPKKGKQRRSSEVSELGNENYEVMIKLPTGELVHMKSAEKQMSDAKQRLKEAIEKKMTTKIESEIRTDIENQIKSEIQMGKFVLNIKDPDTIDSMTSPTIASADNFIVKIATKPTKQIPVVLAPNSILIPVKKIGIPLFQPPPVKKARTFNEPVTRKRKQKKTMAVKRIQHNPHCDILQKLGAQCNLKCGDTIENTPKSIKNNMHSDNVTSNAFSNLILVAPIMSEPSENASVNPNLVIPNINVAKSNATSQINSENNKLNNLEKCNVSPRNTLFTNDLAVAKQESTSFNLIQDNGGEETMHLQSKASDVDLETDGVNKREGNLQAVRRYRSKQKSRFTELSEENRKLTRDNRRLGAELTRLSKELACVKHVFIEHSSVCEAAEEIRQRYEVLYDLRAQR